MREIKFIYTIVRENGFVFNSESMTLEDIELKLAANFLTNNIVRTCDKIHRRQFTGLPDKNGKEIYEGDIVDIEEVGRAEVLFQAGAFMAKWIDDKEAMYDCVGFRCKNGHKWTSIIIGNIYENPELLK